MNNEKVKFLLSWNHFAEHWSSCMTKLMTDGTYSDIIIATADKRMIYSHRFVLAYNSKYFQRLLSHMSGQRGIQLVVALPEIKYEIFKILMNYMYRGETQVPHELLPSVIKAGQFLEINGLVNLNENDSSGSSEGSVKLGSSRESHQRTSIIHSSNSGSNDGVKPFVRLSSTLRDNTHSRENTHNSSKNVFPVEKRAKKQTANDNHSSESLVSEENGKENRSKLTKSSKCKNLSREKKDFIQLPLKRKSSVRESVKKTSPTPSPSSSLSTESFSCPSKKIQKKHSDAQEILCKKVKGEKEGSKSPLQENESQEDQELGERITIKMEPPDDVEEVVYNELRCEFCQEVYKNPPEWVRHMTDHHGDRGFQTYKDLDKSVGGSAVITCVVCSSVCFSAADWAKHLRMWHTDRELALANMTESKKNNKIKKKSAPAKKD